MARPIFIAAAALAITIAVPALVLAQEPRGYLPDDSLDMTRILPPAPVRGDARYANDRRVFR
ncbi:MAG: phosphatase PAP2 family protein, partial [Proteobacteria bacterium]|nr:phosphatase PAP2 family protein [Pseudomonadota bacterium]